MGTAAFRVNPAPLACLALLVVLVAALPAVAPAAERLADLPKTAHAAKSHERQSINAGSLVAMISAGLCRNMQVYECADEDTYKILCEVKPGRITGGLVIGRTVKQIITGYLARPGYWSDNVDGCTPVSLGSVLQ